MIVVPERGFMWPTHIGGPFFTFPPPTPAVLWREEAKRSEADSCCKSSHSRRAPGSPGLVCRTSNVTNHLGFGNTRLSSSPFFSFVIPPLCRSRRHYTRAHAHTLLLSYSSSQLCLAVSRSGGFVLLRLSCPAGDCGRNDDTKRRPH